MNIVVLCGTNREESLSRILARNLAEMYRASGQTVDSLDMRELPTEILTPTAYKEPPAGVVKLVDRFLAADGVVFVVPEYNGSYPGVLKLFIDMLPYPEGFQDRPCAFVGLAAGQFCGLRAVEHCQQVAGYRNALIYPQRVFIGSSYEQFSEGELVQDDLVQRLQRQADGFVDFIEKVKPSDSRESAG